MQKGEIARSPVHSLVPTHVVVRLIGFGSRRRPPTPVSDSRQIADSLPTRIDDALLLLPTCSPDSKHLPDNPYAGKHCFLSRKVDKLENVDQIPHGIINLQSPQ